MASKVLICLSSIVASFTLLVAEPAYAATIVFPSLTNNDAVLTATVSNVTWSGSYNPQIAASVGPGGATSQGTFKTVATSGYSTLQFRANMTSGGTTVTCAYNLSINNSTGVVTTFQAIRWAGSPTCTVTKQGSTIQFFMASNF